MRAAALIIRISFAFDIDSNLIRTMFWWTIFNGNYLRRAYDWNGPSPYGMETHTWTVRKRDRWREKNKTAAQPFSSAANERKKRRKFVRTKTKNAWYIRLFLGFSSSCLTFSIFTLMLPSRCLHRASPLCWTIFTFVLIQYMIWILSRYYRRLDECNVSINGCVFKNIVAGSYAMNCLL